MSETARKRIENKPSHKQLAIVERLRKLLAEHEARKKAARPGRAK